MAQVTLALFQRPKSWIHRRVERIRFIDRETIRRQISVDFTLPAGLPPIASFNGQDVYVAPLFLLSKDHPDPCLDSMRQPLPTGIYSNVVLIDQAGKGLPLLTRRQSSQLAGVVLSEAAAQVAGAGTPIPAELKRTILGIATWERANRQQALNTVLAQDVSAEPSDLRNKLQEDRNGFVELAHLLATYAPVACLFTDGSPGRSVIELSYDESLDQSEPAPRGIIRRSIGWKSEHLSVQVNEIGAGASHHIEIEVPEDLQVNVVSLLGRRYALAGKSWRDLKRDDRSYSIRQARMANSGSLYISNPPYSRRIGRVSIEMRARRFGLLGRALVASIVTTVALSALALVAPSIIDADKSEAAVAALLLLPILLATYIAQPSPHAITSRMLLWARIALVINAALPFIAMLWLVTTSATPSPPVLDLGLFKVALDLFGSGDGSANDLQVRWWILVGVSVLFNAVFLISFIAPLSDRQSHYFPLPKKETEK